MLEVCGFTKNATHKTINIYFENLSAIVYVQNQQNISMLLVMNFKIFH